MPIGIILKGIGGTYSVKSNNAIYSCKARGLFRKDNIKPLAGDKVDFDIISEQDKEGLITKIHDRKNVLVRPAVANVDQMAIIMSIKSPKVDLLLIDKLIVSAFINDITPLLCINKCDLDKENYSQQLYDIYNKAGIKAIMLSAINNVGIDELKSELDNKITVFAGQSGTGKSTTINSIFDNVVMETGSLSEKLQRGRHTTRHVELFEINNGYIIDSPGFNTLDINELEPQELSQFYPEFIKCLNDCRFKECLHVKEPGCAVKEALENGEIDKGRYERYVALVEFLKEKLENKYR